MDSDDKLTTEENAHMNNDSTTTTNNNNNNNHDSNDHKKKNKKHKTNHEKNNNTPNPKSKASSSPSPLRILTVGDGDFTFTLALCRAYGQPQPQPQQQPQPQVIITGSTLLKSQTELYKTYNNAKQVIQELTQTFHIQILYGVDACNLKTTILQSIQQQQQQQQQQHSHDKMLEKKELSYDMIMFNHPHLGTAQLAQSSSSSSSLGGNDESIHALRHSALLSHYLHSASFVTKKYIHVCLCGSQPETWGAKKAAERLGMECVLEVDTMQPVHYWLGRFCCCRRRQNGTTIGKETDMSILNIKSEEEEQQQRGGGEEKNDQTNTTTTTTSLILTPNPILKHYPSPRRYRNGRLGSKHYLGKYGYRHRRTHGDLYVGGDDTNNDMKVPFSVNLIFQCDDTTKKQQRDVVKEKKEEEEEDGLMKCVVCGFEFERKEELSEHYRDPLSSSLLQPDVLSTVQLNDDDEGGGRGGGDKCAMYKDEETGRTFGTLYGLVTFQNQQQKKKKKKKNNCELKHVKDVDANIISADKDNNNNNNNNNSKDNNSNNNNSNAKKFTVTVSSTNNGKRLRWFCRNVMTKESSFTASSSSSYTLSKKQCETFIKQGFVYVNHEIAYDSSRILCENDIVSMMMKMDNVVVIGRGGGGGGGASKCAIARDDTLCKKEKSNGMECTIDDDDDAKSQDVKEKTEQSLSSILVMPNNDSSSSSSSSSSSLQRGKNQIHHRGNVQIVQFTPPNIVVAYKPVGVRTAGSFSSKTLESIVPTLLPSSLLQSFVSSFDNDGDDDFRSTLLPLCCTSLTKLETGCAGLCVLVLHYPSFSPSRCTYSLRCNVVEKKSSCNDVTNRPSVTLGEKLDTVDSLQNPMFASVVGGDVLVTYVFTALVHGIVPKEWMKQEMNGSKNCGNNGGGGGGDDGGVWVDLPSEEGVRRWKRKKNDDGQQHADDTIKQQKKGKEDTLLTNNNMSHSNNNMIVDGDEEKETNAKQKVSQLILEKAPNDISVEKCVSVTSTGKHTEEKIQNTQHPTGGNSAEVESPKIEQKTRVFLQCIEATASTKTRPNSSVSSNDKVVNNPELKLSTIQITTSSNANSGRLCNALCYLLRKMNYPVVNDRFCKREYASLPRFVRNVLKNKLCIGCYGVVINRGIENDNVEGPKNKNGDMGAIEIDIPDRLYASHWVEQGSCKTEIS